MPVFSAVSATARSIQFRADAGSRSILPMVRNRMLFVFMVAISAFRKVPSMSMRKPTSSLGLPQFSSEKA